MEFPGTTEIPESVTATRLIRATITGWGAKNGNPARRGPNPSIPEWDEMKFYSHLIIQL